MNDDSGLELLSFFGLVLILERILPCVQPLVAVLLHPLQEQTRIEAELKNPLHIGNIVVRKGEPADWEGVNGSIVVIVVLLGTEVVDFDHFAVIHCEEPDQILLSISEESLKALSWESTGNYAIGDIGQVQVEAFNDQALLVGWDHGTDFV